MSRAKKTPRKAARKTSRKPAAKKPTPPKAEPQAEEPTPEQVVAAVRQMRALPHETLVAVVQLLEGTPQSGLHTVVANLCKQANTVGTLADVNGLTIAPKG